MSTTQAQDFGETGEKSNLSVEQAQMSGQQTSNEVSLASSVSANNADNANTIDTTDYANNGIIFAPEESTLGRTSVLQVLSPDRPTTFDAFNTLPAEITQKILQLTITRDGERNFLMCFICRANLDSGAQPSTCCTSNHRIYQRNRAGVLRLVCSQWRDDITALIPVLKSTIAEQYATSFDIIRADFLTQLRRSGLQAQGLPLTTPLLHPTLNPPAFLFWTPQLVPKDTLTKENNYNRVAVQHLLGLRRTAKLWEMPGGSFDVEVKPSTNRMVGESLGTEFEAWRSTVRIVRKVVGQVERCLVLCTTGEEEKKGEFTIEGGEGKLAGGGAVQEGLGTGAVG